VDAAIDGYLFLRVLLISPPLPNDSVCNPGSSNSVGTIPRWRGTRVGWCSMWCESLSSERKESDADMKNSVGKVQINNSWSDKLGFLAAALGAASICSGAAPTQEATKPIWPTKEWQTSSPEEQGMDSDELAELVDFGARRVLATPGVTLSSMLDSLLVVRHGKIVVEVYYAPYAAGIPHTINSVTKAVISTLTAIAWEDGVLDSPSHRVLDFFDRSSIANVDQKKEAITVQNLLDMASGIEWTEPLDGVPASVIEMERDPDWVKFILDRPMSSSPGDIFNCNSGNPHLLSAIITKLTGMSAVEYGKTKFLGLLASTTFTGDAILKACRPGDTDCTYILATWRRSAICTCAMGPGKVCNCFPPLGSIRSPMPRLICI
jgi:CubicO group peptidase (beta-lactamase class C family)